MARSIRRRALATGFTGQLVAEYLTRHYGVGGALRWALGGRSKAKLEKVRAALEAIDPRARSLPLLLGDGSDRASLDCLAIDAHVVCSTVGPYALHGRELRRRLRRGWHRLLHFTGEPNFVRAMIDLHHERAGATGARIVCCCGFDSIPSDLGTLMVQDHSLRAHGAACHEVKCFVSLKGAVSGGTAATMVLAMDEGVRDPAVRRLLSNPYALDPERVERGPDGHDQRGVRWDADLERWTGPFLMAAVNTRVCSLKQRAPRICLGTRLSLPRGHELLWRTKGWLEAAAVSAGTTLGTAAMALGPLRRWVARRVLPAPGQGPSKRSARAASSSCAWSERSKPGQKGRGRSSEWCGAPAIPVTARPRRCSPNGGVSGQARRGHPKSKAASSTPASCMGMRLVERLRVAGMTFEVQDSPEKLPRRSS